ncbi:MAG: VCBS repeat-containing protein [Caldilineaceae bacterium]
MNERGKLWLQHEDGTFDEVAEAVNFGEPVNQLGLLTFDYDNDGDRDVVVTAYNDGLRLYRNELTGADTHWLRVVLDTSSAAGLAPNGMGNTSTASPVTSATALPDRRRTLPHAERVDRAFRSWRSRHRRSVACHLAGWKHHRTHRCGRGSNSHSYTVMAPTIHLPGVFL